MSAIVTMVGNVGRVGELRSVNDTEVVDFTVASNNRRTDATTWMTCAAWGGLATKVVGPYLQKGDRVFVTGDLHPVRTYEGANGPGAEMRMRVTNIELLGAGTPSENTGQRADRDSDLPF